MRGLFVHTVVYAVINALLIGVWLLTTGSQAALGNVHNDPIAAVKAGFWPLIVIAAWGGGLVIHAAVVVGSILPGSKRSRARRAKRREFWAHAINQDRERRHRRAAAGARSDGETKPKSTSISRSSSKAKSGAVPDDLAKHAAQAAIGLVESLAGRAASRPSKPPAQTPGRQWVAVMFTDLVGSTGLAESLGDAPWHEMLVQHRQLVRECISSHDGLEVGTQGDGFLVRFPTPDGAVACAVELQRKMGKARESGAFVPELRVGIHAGEAVADDNDLVGRVINLAARVTDAAAPGEILVTEPVADHLSPGVGLMDRGLKPLKGFAQPRHLLAVAWHATDETIVLTADLEDERPGERT
ncbi:MAG TPA: adenylate/guanylate cyclase domain-containing protein [Acidimicrobiales bacterium]|jgi:class 3 adenylate cyclase|nr:adenylate/guanylate cyclase domain-containing protein [Acidimicrobiales bacterium]